nr:uncharacterized protein LOC127327572 [Lolium perenne]
MDIDDPTLEALRTSYFGRCHPRLGEIQHHHGRRRPVPPPPRRDPALPRSRRPPHHIVVRARLSSTASSPPAARLPARIFPSRNRRRPLSLRSISSPGRQGVSSLGLKHLATALCFSAGAIVQTPCKSKLCHA